MGFGVFYVKIVPVAHADGGKEGIKFAQAVVPHPGPPRVGEGGEQAVIQCFDTPKIREKGRQRGIFK